LQNKKKYITFAANYIIMEALLVPVIVIAIALFFKLKFWLEDRHQNVEQG